MQDRHTYRLSLDSGWVMKAATSSSMLLGMVPRGVSCAAATMSKAPWHAETEVTMLRKLQKHDPELARRHVVRLLDTFVHEESFYCIVMEPLAMSLRNLLQDGSSGGLFMADIRLAAFQLTSCLAFFQSLNMAHGDLKCTNVMLRRSEFSLQPHPRLGDPDEVAARPLWPFEAPKWFCSGPARISEGHHPQLYPMWVVAMEDLLQMHGVPPSHQELKDAGLLVECKPSFHSVFVSHQWLGKNHPDEKGSHSPALSMSAFPSSTWHASCG
eukprot:s9104_g1.t1